MKRTARFSMIAALIAAPLAAQTAPPPAGEEEETSPLEVSFETTFASQFLWRGFVINDSPSLEPAVTVGYKGLSVTTWHNFSRRVPHGQAWTEHDLDVSYSREFGKFTATGGYVRYSYPDLTKDEGNATNELYAGISHASFLNPSFKVYRDVTQGKGNYYYASVGHGFPVGRVVTANVLAGAGLNQHMYVTQTVLSNVDFGVSVDVACAKGTNLSPFFTQSVGHTIFGRHNQFGIKLTVEK